MDSIFEHLAKELNEAIFYNGNGSGLTRVMWLRTSELGRTLMWRWTKLVPGPARPSRRDCTSHVTDEGQGL